MLKWIFERCNAQGEEGAEKTPIGYAMFELGFCLYLYFSLRFVPKKGALDTSGLNISPEVMSELFRFEKSEWENDLQSLRKFLSQFGENVPKGVTEEANALEQRIIKA